MQPDLSRRAIIFSVTLAGIFALLASGNGSESKVPVHQGIYVEDARKVQLGPASEFGGRGAYLDFGYRTIDGRIGEIAPGDEWGPHQHFYEIFFYILEGQGQLETWLNKETTPHIIKWEKDSLFTVPLNAWYRLVNTDPERPVLYLAITDEPFRRLLFDAEFLRSNPSQFTAGWKEFLQLEYDHIDLRTWQGQVFHHLKTHPTEPWPERLGRNAYFLSGNRTLNAHISEVPPDSAKKGHHHLNEAIIYILKGEGYSLVYAKEGDPPRKVHWKEGSVLAVPLDYWHQHYNIQPYEPARYLAFKNTPLMYNLIGRDGVHHEEPGYDKAY